MQDCDRQAQSRFQGRRTPHSNSKNNNKKEQKKQAIKLGKKIRRYNPPCSKSSWRYPSARPSFGKRRPPCQV